MSPPAFLVPGRPCVFHVRMGGCGGCTEMVDAALRDGRGFRRLCECTSPRHAEAAVVTGCWTDELAEAASRVISQAPAGGSLVVVGDCALGLGFITERARLTRSVLEAFDADLEVAGCPIDVAEFVEGVRRVAG